MRIAIYGRKIEFPHLRTFNKLIEQLKTLEIDFVLYTELSHFLNRKMGMKEPFKEFTTIEGLEGKVDLVMSLGGDGTFLDAAHLIKESNIPIIGINMGRLGFLALISIEELRASLQQLKSGEYVIERRSTISLEMEGINPFGPNNFALNEITFLKKDSSSMLKVTTELNGTFLTTYWSDGLIVSTPTGSTAYSMSCGGPIVAPGSENFLITPIAPHNLSMRPMVIPDKSILTLEVTARTPNFLVALDSDNRTFPNKSKFTVKLSKYRVNMVNLHGNDFFKTLTKKLHWGIDQRN